MRHDWHYSREKMQYYSTIQKVNVLPSPCSLVFSFYVRTYEYKKPRNWIPEIHVIVFFISNLKNYIPRKKIKIQKKSRNTMREARPLLRTIFPNPATPMRDAITHTPNMMIPHPYNSLSPRANWMVAVLLDAPTRRRLVAAATSGWRPRSIMIGPKIMPPE